MRQPLTTGEWRVLEFFDEHLSAEWEIYVQPHLNGLRPDFVLLHPRVGIAVFEVKDWDLDTMERWMEARDRKPPALKGRRDGKTFSLQSDNPIEKVIRYQREITQLYCPGLNQRSGLAVVTAGVMFPCSEDGRVRKLLSPSLEYHGKADWSRYYPVTGRHAIESGDLSSVFPESARTSSNVMTPELASDLRLWLREPDAPVTQRAHLVLDTGQRRLVDTRTDSGYRRITGPAGSGKSLVLAARAAKLVSEGRDVLIVTFNITLLNYLADAAVREFPGARKDATWLHFHAWLRRVCEETDNLEEFKTLHVDQDDVPTHDVCQLAASAIAADTDGLVPRYDAIIVDEGQDFQPEWWDLLRRAGRAGCEMLLAADATQDIYGTARKWTEVAMTGAGFTGNWSRLAISYRLPAPMIDHVKEFGERFLPKTDLDLPENHQLELGIFPCSLRWIQVLGDDVANAAVSEMWSLLTTHGQEAGLAVSDVNILVDRTSLGRRIAELLAGCATRCITTFDRTPEGERMKKRGFFMGDASVKVTTLHSFKGWEARAILICVTRVQSARDNALLYSGLTRLKPHPSRSFLRVISAEPRLESYGQGWPDFESRLEALEPEQRQ